MTTAGASSAANDATVSDAPADADYRKQLADEAEAGVKATKAHIKSLQDSLKTREAEAKRLRAEAKES